MSHNFELVVATIGILALFLFKYFLKTCNRKPHNIKHNPPQPSGSWPLLGHLPLLGDLPHISLGKLADRYGPIFMVKLGVNRALIVSKPDIAKECLGINDKVFANRPHTIFVEHLTYNSAMFGFSKYNQYWRDIRKITNTELLSNSRIEMLKHVRISEVRSAIRDIHDHLTVNKSKSYDMKQCFSDISMNTIVRLISGKSLKELYKGEEYDKCAKAFRDYFELAGTHVIGDLIPFLRWLDIGGYEKQMKKVAKVIDNVAQKWLEEHKERRGSKEARDFIDVMLGIFETGHKNASMFDVDTIVKATCSNLILAATDTTSITLTWALSLLLNNRDVLTKTQQELDTVVGKERRFEESDLKSLVYLKAVLKEAMRLYPAGPLLVPREAITDCTINGYHIRAGTQLYVNLYKIQRDPKLWENPLDFQPERFLTTHKDVGYWGKHFEFMPFGCGRRICPGISSALQSMELTLASLLHEFDISTPLNESVDMTMGFGLSCPKATPLEVILANRLSRNLK